MAYDGRADNTPPQGGNQPMLPGTCDCGHDHHNGEARDDHADDCIHWTLTSDDDYEIAEIVRYGL